MLCVCTLQRAAYQVDEGGAAILHAHFLSSIMTVNINQPTLVCCHLSDPPNTPLYYYSALDGEVENLEVPPSDSDSVERPQRRPAPDPGDPVPDLESDAAIESFLLTFDPGAPHAAHNQPRDQLNTLFLIPSNT